MKHIKYIIIAVISFVFNTSFSQDSKALVEAYLNQNVNKLNINNIDIKDWDITSEHISKLSKINHIYGIQKYNGIEIYDATFDLHLINTNEVVKFNSNFISNLKQKTSKVLEAPKIPSIKAFQMAAKQLNIVSNKPIKTIETAKGKNQKQLLSAGGISTEKVPVKLMYFLNNSNQLSLVWDMSISESNGENWWSLKIDANTGQILHKANMVISCSFGEHEHSNASDNANTSNDIIHSKNSTSSLMVGSYNVYPMPIESPNHGGRSVITNPDNATASPFGWHDTNGRNGAEFTITRGNNVYAYDDDDNNNAPGFSPNGGSGLSFNFPVNTTYSSANQSEAAAITNLFYWNNLCHDVWYQYGFNETSGNFQENNYGKGGSASDSVSAEAQDGSGTCNANFGTPRDGFNPRMQMYTCNSRDGDLDNLVIVHEYGHGISTRLVGGSNNVSSLRNQEQMGEGWSDWFGLMMTIKSRDISTKNRPVGTWLRGQGATGAGIREYPYSTNMTTSKYTYDDIKSLSVPHGVGSVWASMLWELTWGLIDRYGYDSNLYNGNGGNNIAMKLVIEGLKLTPSSPGFVNGRNAIIQADNALYNGANNCIIWEAFAKRGLGVSASQGLSSSRSDGTEAFNVPKCFNCEENKTITINVNSGQTDNQEASNRIIAANIILNGGRASYNAGNLVHIKPGFHARNGSTFNAFIEDCSSNNSSIIEEEREKITVIYESVEAKNNTFSENKEDDIIQAYPNPVKDMLVIKSQEQILSWELKDHLGKLVNNSKSNKKAFIDDKINVSQITTGFYILKINLTNGKTIYKNIIKN